MTSAGRPSKWAFSTRIAVIALVLLVRPSTQALTCRDAGCPDGAGVIELVEAHAGLTLLLAVRALRLMS